MIETKEDEVVVLKTKLTSCETEVKILKSKLQEQILLNESMKNVSQIQQQKSQSVIHSTVSDLTVPQVYEAEQEKKKLQKRNEELQSYVDALEKELSSTKKGLEVSKSDNEDLSQRNDELIHANEEFKAELQKKDIEIRHLSTTLSAQSEKIRKDLKLQHDNELDLLNQNIEILKHKIKELQPNEILSRLKQEELENLGKKMEKYQRMEIEMNHLKAQQSNSEILKMELSDLQQRIQFLSKVEQENLGLQTKINLLESKLSSICSLLSMPNTLTSPSTNSSGIATSKSYGINEFRRQIESIVMEGKLLKEKTSLLEGDMSMLKKTNNLAKDQLQALQSELLKRNNELGEMQALKTVHEIKIVNQQAEIQNLKELMKVYELECSSISGDQQNLKRFEELQENLMKKDKQIMDMEQQLQNQTSLLSKEKEKLEMMTGRVFLIQKELEEKSKTEQEMMERYLKEIEALEKRLGQGEYNPNATKVLHLKVNPELQAKAKKTTSDLEKLKAENILLQSSVESLQQRLKDFNQSAHSQQVSDDSNNLKVLDLKKKLDDLQLDYIRLKEICQKKITEFKRITYLLLGYKIDVFPNEMYKLSSMFAEHEEDHLMFQLADKDLKILESDFFNNLEKNLLIYLENFHCFPAFLSSVTLHLFNKQTTFA